MPEKQKELEPAQEKSVVGTSHQTPAAEEKEEDSGNESEEGHKYDIAHHLNCMIKRMELIDKANQWKDAQYDELYEAMEKQYKGVLKQQKLIEELEERVAIQESLFKAEC